MTEHEKPFESNSIIIDKSFTKSMILIQHIMTRKKGKPMSHDIDNPDNSEPGGNNKAAAGGDRRLELPDPPDIGRVHRLRKQLRADRAAGQAGKSRNFGKFDPATGKRIRDVGFYTLLPMVMIAGPLLGYFIGRLLEMKFGGEPWPVTIGVLVGLAAGFRQVYLMLAGKTHPKDQND